MQQFSAFGIAFGGFDMTNPHNNEFAVYCAGTDTVHAHVDIPAGARVWASIPARKEMSKVHFQTDSPAEQIPFILTPVEPLSPGIVLKHAVRCKVFQEKG